MVVKSSYAEQIERVWTSLFKTARSSDYMCGMLINQHLSELLTILMSESWHPEDRSVAAKRQSVMNVKEYMEQHYGEKIFLDELSNIF